MEAEREQWKEGAKKGWRVEHVQVEGSPITPGPGAQEASHRLLFDAGGMMSTPNHYSTDGQSLNPKSMEQTRYQLAIATEWRLSSPSQYLWVCQPSFCLTHSPSAWQAAECKLNEKERLPRSPASVTALMSWRSISSSGWLSLNDFMSSLAMWDVPMLCSRRV